jgi:aryl-alcohol dehydrogenase-like predicted oxidoreductase
VYCARIERQPERALVVDNDAVRRAEEVPCRVRKDFSRMALRPDGVDELLTPAVYDAIDRLRLQAQRRYGVECGALALAWLLHHREVTAVVTGPARGSPHLELAARAVGVVLSDADFAEIESWFPTSAAVGEPHVGR